MRRLAFVIFAAAMAIWDLTSIVDGSDIDQPSPVYRRGELAGTSDKAFLGPTRKAAASDLRAAPLDSCGAVPGSGICFANVGVSLSERSWR